MSRVDKYIKAAKSILIRSSEEDLEKKIIQRIANVSSNDEKLIDEKFLDYMKKINSRPYILSEWILNNPIKLGFIVAGSAAFAILVYIMLRKSKK